MIFDIKPLTSVRELDCGPTCLKMLLSYYGIEEELNVLIKKCNTGIMGCSMSDLSRIGKEYGLDMKIYKELEKDIPGVQAAQNALKINVGILEQDRPAIIWWKYHHFCVFGGVDENNNVIIYNPDKGKYRMDQGTFWSFFSGISVCNGQPKKIDSID